MTPQPRSVRIRWKPTLVALPVLPFGLVLIYLVGVATGLLHFSSTVMIVIAVIVMLSSVMLGLALLVAVRYQLNLLRTGAEVEGTIVDTYVDFIDRRGNRIEVEYAYPTEIHRGWMHLGMMVRRDFQVGEKVRVFVNRRWATSFAVYDGGYFEILESDEKTSR